MISATFKKPLFISVISHITIFSLFVFSFGRKLSVSDYPGVTFRGAILKSYDFLNYSSGAGIVLKKIFPHPRADGYALIKKPLPALQLYEPGSRNFYYTASSSKPQAELGAVPLKEVSVGAPAVKPASLSRKQPVVTFYPVLPYYFSVYFKDRETVHMELMFNIEHGDKGKSFIEVKRKISSGNLEVDLLSMHYISHYLFLQQARFPPDTWQTVKIDFSAKE